MVTIQIDYQGDLHCAAVHGPSHTALNTDAPQDNHGRGESFSPTDLVATALGTCLLTTMAIVARTLGIDISGATATVDKEMTSAPVRRILKLTVSLSMPQRLNDAHRQALERAAYTCPVHESLHPDVQIPISFRWG